MSEEVVLKDPLVESGRVIGKKYRLIRTLGEGGMGTVYEAENTWTGRRVALKILRQELTRRPKVVDRFLQEGRSTTMVAHPNIVDVLDMDKDPELGSVYMVQEFLVGTSLHHLLKRKKRLSLQECLDILLPVMGALSAAHELSIIHRDVTPQNVVLTHHPQGHLVPKLIDFGISKLLDEADTVSRTQPGCLIGTPLYMSPERFVDNTPLDGRADVWSVGVLCFRILAGRCPFVHTNVFELCRIIRENEPPRLESFSPRIPAKFASVIHKALERNIEDRYPTMDAFLNAILECGPIEGLVRNLVDKHRDSIPYHREHERYDIGWQATLKCEDWKFPRHMQAANVSRNGVFLSTDRPSEVGMRAEVRLELPNGSRLRLRGTIKRVVTKDETKLGGTPGVGIKFDREHDLELVVVEQMAIAHQEPSFEELPRHVAPDPKLDEGKRPISNGLEQTIKSRTPKLQPLKPQVMNGRRFASAVGIDFGTTYGSMSIALDEKVYLITDEKRRGIHPSVVSYPEKGQPIAGWAAKERLLKDPRRTISSVKRVIGRNFDEPTLAGYLYGLPYKATEGPNKGVVFEVDGTPIAPVQVAAEIIDHLRLVGERRTGQAIKRAVVSVPVAYNKVQRRAIQKAAEMAGLEVLALIEEPIAGVKAYGHGRDRQEIVAVYDFGGGTFDFSILSLSGNQHEILATNGDPWLGGDDFDMAVARDASNQFWRQTGTDLQKRAVEWQRLLYASEQVKRALSFQERAEITLPGAISYPKAVDLRQELSRDGLEELCSDIYMRSMELCREGLRDAGIDQDRIDRVVVTGGMSRVPFILKGLSSFFKKEITPVINPEQAVCLGAGVHAAVLVQHEVDGAARKRD